MVVAMSSSVSVPTSLGIVSPSFLFALYRPTFARS